MTIKKPDAPMMLASVQQAVRTLREWGWEVTPVMGHRNRYRAQKPRGNTVSRLGRKPEAEMVTIEVRAGRGKRLDYLCTAAGEALHAALLDDLFRRCSWGSLDAIATQIISAHSIFRDRTHSARELALYLSRILRDAYPDVADLLDVHAHGGSL